MSTFVLIHGAWHGAWCWKNVVPLLEQAGHTVIAPDLPSHGQDTTPIDDVTLQSYTERVCAIVRAQAEPVILVGHSMGGVVITQAAEQCPDRIKALVYLCAFLPGNGESLLDLAQQDPETLVLPNLVVSDDQSRATVSEQAIKDAFYGDCSSEDIAWAKTLLVPQALAPFATPVRTTEASFGRVPRVYIEGLQDRAIPIALQRRMHSALPCRTVITMNTSHSPFFSAPEALAVRLTSL